MKRSGFLCAVTLAILFSATLVGAVEGPPKGEASERFERGLTLSEAGDLNAALAEFERANELAPQPVVLFNMGLLQIALDRSVEAEATLAKLVAASGSLSFERFQKANVTLSAVREKVGEASVEVSIAGAQIEVDGLVVGTAPLKAPIRLATGTHVVGALAAGHAPVRKTVTIAAQTKVSLRLEPPTIEGRLAHLAVKTGLPGASLLVDGELVARTPVLATITLLPGSHELVLERDGYRSARTRIELGEGAVGEVTLEVEEDPVALRARGGDLALVLSESLGHLTVDGRSRGTYLAPIRLAVGPHRLLVARAGFRSIERDVVIASGRTVTVELTLEPTPETRLHYLEQTTKQRTAGIVALVSGLAVTGASGIFLGWNAGNKVDQQREFDKLFQRCVTGTESQSLCARLSQRESAYNQALTLDVAGGIGVGLGALGIVTASILFLSRDDPARYDPKPGEGLNLLPVVSVDRTGGTLGIVGTF